MSKEGMPRISKAKKILVKPAELILRNRGSIAGIVTGVPEVGGGTLAIATGLPEMGAVAVLAGVSSIIIGVGMNGVIKKELMRRRGEAF